MPSMNRITKRFTPCLHTFLGKQTISLQSGNAAGPLWVNSPVRPSHSSRTRCIQLRARDGYDVVCILLSIIFYYLVIIVSLSTHRRDSVKKRLKKWRIPGYAAHKQRIINCDFIANDYGFIVAFGSLFCTWLPLTCGQSSGGGNGAHLFSSFDSLFF